MIGNHGNQIILDNLVKKTGEFDTQTAYQAMREQVRLSSLMDYTTGYIGNGPQYSTCW